MCAGAHAYFGARLGWRPGRRHDGVGWPCRWLRPLILSRPVAVGGRRHSSGAGRGSSFDRGRPEGTALGGGFQRVIAEGFEDVVAAFEQFASERQARSVTADPLGELQVVVAVGAGREPGALRGLIHRPAQRRRSLAGEMAGRAALVGLVDGDVDGRVIPLVCLAFGWVRWWSRIRFIRCAITRPSVRLVRSEPNQYPSVNRRGRGSSSMIVVAATSDGFRADTNASPTTLPMDNAPPQRRFAPRWPPRSCGPIL